MRRSLSETEKAELLNYMQQRFGIDPNVFMTFHFERTNRDIWLMPIELLTALPDSIEIEKRGLRSFNGDKHPPKPTTTFLQRFGRHVTTCRVELNADQLADFFKGVTIVAVVQEVENGYVMVSRHHIPIGCGFARNGNLESQFPLNTGRSINQRFL